MFWGPGCNARPPRVGALSRAGRLVRYRGVVQRTWPVDRRSSVSEEPFIAKEVNGLWAANTRAANEISELCSEDLSSSSACAAGPRPAQP
ncbi:hypothetical protein BCEP27_120043 [Burkholderia cepacia]